MKQFPSPSFEQVAKEALAKAADLKVMPMVSEAIDRAVKLMAMNPEDAEKVLANKMNEGKNL